jgi:3alpha(or 20beta)-hydroxysteroid dehydrogenase
MGDRLAGKVALISGGARGQGAEHGRRFALEGCCVLLGDIRDDEGRRATAGMRADGLEVVYTHLDVTKPDEWQAAVAEVEERFGKLDVLVNNAGIIAEGGAVDEALESWDRVIAVNQTGVFLGMRSVVPAMRRAGGGAIINVSSVLGVTGAEGYIAYQASKAAVIAMTRSAALSYVEDGIRVNAVCPGFITTPMTDALPPAIHKHDVGATPMLRPGTPEEVSSGVLYLVSDEASFVTGTVLSIDGGYLAQ